MGMKSKLLRRRHNHHQHKQSKRDSDDLPAVPNGNVGGFFRRVSVSSASKGMKKRLSRLSFLTQKTANHEEDSSSGSMLEGDALHVHRRHSRGGDPRDDSGLGHFQFEDDDRLDVDGGESLEQEDVDLDRTTVRLDGLEAYAVVSALTSATSIQCFESFNFESFANLWSTGSYFTLLEDSVFIAAGSTGILAGLHATLVFSLMTAYGRTAVGMQRDDALDTFFAKTGLQRYRGFQTFLYSMKTFLVQVFVMIDKKMPPEIRFLSFLGLSYILWKVYLDTDAIIRHAGVIFAPVPAPPPPPQAQQAQQQQEPRSSFSSRGSAGSGRGDDSKRKPSFLLPATNTTGGEPRRVSLSVPEEDEPNGDHQATVPAPAPPPRRRESFQRAKSSLLQPAIPAAPLLEDTEGEDSFVLNGNESFSAIARIPARSGQGSGPPPTVRPSVQRRESFRRSKSSFMMPATEFMTQK